MTERSRFWDGAATGDASEAPYDASTEFAQVLMALSGANEFTDKGGVWGASLNGLALSNPSANTLRVATGQAQVYGTWYENDANVDTNIPTPSGSTRVDRIVLRKSWASQTVRVTRIAGTEGSGAPAITQSLGVTWDLPLGQVSITTAGVMSVTDQRVFLGTLGAPVRQNLTVNPGFEIWQRGVGPFTTHNVYTADGWYTFLQGSTVSVDRESTIVDSDSRYSLKVTYTHSAGVGNQFVLLQKVEDPYQLRGKTVTFSARVRQNVAGAVRLEIQGASLGFSAVVSSALTGAFTTLSVSVTVPTNETSLILYIQSEATVTYYIDNAMLVVGTVAAYSPLHPSDDLARCQRYYEIHYGSSGASGPCIYQSAGGAHVLALYVPLAVTKIGIPTVTKTGTWAVTNCGQPTVDQPSINGYRLSTTASGAGQVNCATNSADDTVTIEANP